MGSERDFTITGGHTVFTGYVFRVEVQDVAYADGTTVTRDVVCHPGAIIPRSAMPGNILPGPESSRKSSR